MSLTAGAAAFVRASVHGSIVGVGTIQAQVTTFHDVFGYLGVASIVVFVFSAIWTLLLAVIQVYPNEMANRIMRTEDFDSGEFWLLPNPDMSIVATSVVILTTIAMGYLSLAVYMIGGLRHVRDHSAVVSSPQVKVQQTARSDARERGKLTKWWKGLPPWLKRLTENPTPLQRHYYVSLFWICIDG
jgi:hypothetical protein